MPGMRSSKNKPTRSRRCRSREEIDRLIAAFKNSGQTQTAFADEHGLNVGTLRGWLYKRRSRPAEPDSFREVLVSAPVRPLNPGAGEGTVIVRTAGGAEVELPLGAGLDWVRGVVKELVVQ